MFFCLLITNATLLFALFPQLMSEKVGGAEGTKLDEDFKELERKADVTSKAVVDVISKTTEYLQPNPKEISWSVVHSSETATI
uniref:BAR domain-containing protein n=1 Tax=Fundulus heteroclitus TaxID=8078 RepID=A0A3Q2NQP2_FUNHE